MISARYVSRGGAKAYPAKNVEMSSVTNAQESLWSFARWSDRWGPWVKTSTTARTAKKKSADLKSVLKSIENLASEVKTFKNGQDEQQVERERVIEGLEVVETVVKKIESIETVQVVHEERLTAQELATIRNDEKIDEGLK